MSSGVIIAVVGSTAVVVVRAVVVVGRRVVERLVDGAVTSRRYVWYQSETEEKGNHRNIWGICLFLFISAALTWSPELNHCLPMKVGFLTSTLGLSNLLFIDWLK